LLLSKTVLAHHDLNTTGCVINSPVTSAITSPVGSGYIYRTIVVNGLHSDVNTTGGTSKSVCSLGRGDWLSWQGLLADQIWYGPQIPGEYNGRTSPQTLFQAPNIPGVSDSTTGYHEFFQDDAALIIVNGTMVYCRGMDISGCEPPSIYDYGVAPPSIITGPPEQHNCPWPWGGAGWCLENNGTPFAFGVVYPYQGAGFVDIDPPISAMPRVTVGGDGRLNDISLVIKARNTYKGNFVGQIVFSVRYPQIPVNDYPPTGTVAANCNTLSGTVTDQDKSGANMALRIYKDDVLIASPNSTGDDYTVDIGAHRDFRAHTFRVEAQDIDAAGGPHEWTEIGSASSGPCVTPKCAVTNSAGANPEVGVEFYITVKITYVPGSQGAAITDAEFNMLIRITGPSSPPPLYNNPNVLFTPIPPIGGGVGISGPALDNMPGIYTIVATLTGPSTPSTIYCSGVGTNTKPKCVPIPGLPCTPCILSEPECPVDPCNPLTDSDCPDPPRIVLKPYLKIYGDDVCSGGRVTAFAQPFSGFFGGLAYQGAGSQFATFAGGDINGFASAILRLTVGTTPALAPNGLSFANTASPPGNFALANCADNYTDPGVGGTFIESGPNLLADTSTHNGIYRNGSSLTIASDPGNYAHIRDNNRFIVYVNGDLTIMGNIFYERAISFDNTWASLDAIPSATFVVTGNIYITNKAKEITGTYVAKPRANGTGGTIYTCTGIDDKGTLEVSDDTHRLLNVNELYANCDSQLIVRGQLIANSIKWLRTYKSLKDNTTAFEHPYNLGTFPNAAELIINGPESYMSRPASGLPSSTGSKTYDSITSLPPIL